MQKLRDNRWVIVIILLTIAGAMLFQTYGMESYSRFNSTTLEYVKGTVMQVTAENLTYEEDLDINVGTQDLIIRLDEGGIPGRRDRSDQLCLQYAPVRSQRGHVGHHQCR